MENATFNPDATLVTILITDSPTHGLQYHDSDVSDNHLSVPTGSLESAVLRLVKKPKLSYFCCYRLNKTTDMMYQKMKHAYEALVIAEAADPSKFLILLIDSLTESITLT